MPGLAWPRNSKCLLLDKLHQPVPDNLHGPAPRRGFCKLLSLPEKGLGETISRNVGETKKEGKRKEALARGSPWTDSKEKQAQGLEAENTLQSQALPLAAQQDRESQFHFSEPQSYHPSK